MAHAGVPFLAVRGLHAQIHRIVRKDLFDLLWRHVVAGDVRNVRFVPIENQFIRCSYTYVVCIHERFKLADRPGAEAHSFGQC
jgi:hypothetical protein